ncbi:MAG: Lrp/AsnC family transcriptional regulator, partial [Oricola sp.]|nr:Lrp/AsnC family transcriptional regulator [Oricola sp.]
MKLSAEDLKLLSLLREDARATTSDLARRLGVSRTTVQTRMERLRSQRVIVGYTGKTAPAFEESQIMALVTVVIAPKVMNSVVAALKKRPEIRRIYSVNGPYDLFMEIAAPSVAEVDQVLDAIGEMEGVERTTSMIVL